MSATVLEHPLVRDYLRRLDAACAALPYAQARELRDQIIAHLDEALPPDSADGEVAAELARLGSPAALAAEAAGPVRPPARTRLRNRLARLGWRAWALIAAAVVLIVVLIAGAATYLNSVLSAAPLMHDGPSAWWFPQDRYARGATTTTAGDVTQLSVPERWGQQQGIAVGIYNDSDWTQTIVGLGGAWAQPGDLAPVLIAVGSDPEVDEGGFWSAKTHWDRPGTIPPHSIRVLRILWTSGICNDPGGSTIIQDVTLRVRVGLITRTEDFQLGNAWAITGTSTSSPARACSVGVSRPTPGQ
jgi:hypothetical protein